MRSPEADEAGEAAPNGATEYTFPGYSFDDKPSEEPATHVPPYPGALAEPTAGSGSDFSGSDFSSSDFGARAATDESASRTSTFSAVRPGRYLAGAGAAGSLTGAGKAARAARVAKAARPSKPSSASQASARRADLVVARLEPWSVMKFSFLMSLVAWVVLFVAVAFLYFTLSSLGVFTSVQHTLSSVTSSTSSSGMNLNHWFSASRILGYTMLLGAVNIVLITALCTVGSMIYNLVTHLGGGIEITLRETD